MLLTMTARMPAARDLGHLLRKHPDRVQRIDVTAGTGWVFYPRADEEECTVALLVEIEPLPAASGRSAQVGYAPLRDYVSDVRWSAGSLMSTALKQAFRSAMSGRNEGYPELAAAAVDLRLELPVVPLLGPADLPDRLFAPLGWEVRARPIPADETVPEWGDAPLVALSLTGRSTVADALNQLYVLLPVLHDRRHHWVDESTVDTLLRAGGVWLAAHPERELITSRSLAHRRDHTRDALHRLAEIDPVSTDLVTEGTAIDVPGRPLAAARRAVVMAELAALHATSVVDLGCGEGALLADLLDRPGGITKVVGADVSTRALSRAARRLHLDQRPERAPVVVELLTSSVVYRDARLRGHDAIVLMEVVEHLDPGRLPALEDAVFAAAAPASVLVTTPNGEYNVRYPGLEPGAFRHPDHRFEFSRSEFAAWSRGVAGRHGYRVRLESVGPVDPEVGSPTQLAVFSR